MTDRVKEIDYIRAISVLGVITIHITSGYLAHNNVAYFVNQRVRSAVPLYNLMYSPGSSMKPTVIIYTIISFMFFYAIATKLKNTKIAKILKFISDKSFLIYFSHVLVMILLQEHFASFLIGTTGMILLFTATTGLTFLFVFLIDTIPLSFYLGGRQHLSPRQGMNKDISVLKDIKS